MGCSKKYVNKGNLIESPIGVISITFDSTLLYHCLKTLEILRES